MKNGKYCNGKKSLNMKPLAVLLTLTLLVGCAIGGTIAWLTAQSGPVTNTFTVGDINITLDETVDDEFKIVPGATDPKDPSITVLEKSEKCYVYAYVKNDVALNNNIVATPDINETDWELIGTKITDQVVTDETVTKTAVFEKLYRYKGALSVNGVVDAGTAAKTIPVFENVSYSAEITKGDILTLKDTKIIVDAFAHQSDNTTVAVADAAAKTHFGFTANP